MTTGIGYTHAMFAIGSKLRNIALAADQKENGGNDNGLIDGNETTYFLTETKKLGINFDFSKITESETKEVQITNSNGNSLYDGYLSGLSNAYANNGVTNKSTISLNNGDPFKGFKKDGKAKIAYLDEENFTKSQDYVAEIEQNFRKQQEEAEAEAKAKAEQGQEKQQKWEDMGSIKKSWIIFKSIVRDRWLRH